MKKQSSWKGINEMVLIVLLLIAVPALSWSATISGTVRDSIGNPIFGAGNEIGIKVWRGDPCDNHDYVGETVSNSADGTYSMAGLPAGTYYLVTHYIDTNYVNEWWNGDSPDPSNHDCSLAESITVALGDTVSGTDFRLELGGTIYGTVKDSTGTPITGSGNEIYVSVVAGDPCGDHYRVEGAKTNSANGTYRIVVPVGTIYLQTNRIDTNYLNEWWNGDSPDPSNFSCTLAKSITVASGDTVSSIDFHLDLGATISGTVKDNTGTPITGSEIEVSALAGQPCGDHYRVEGVRTNPADGTYHIVVPAGTYYLQSNHIDTNYVNEWWNGDSPDPSNFSCTLAESITVASGDTVTNIDFRLDPGATISGTVRDSIGTPITGSGIDVSVLAGDPCDYHYHIEGAWINTADGTYRIVVPTGTYYLLTNHIETNYVNEWWNGGSPDPSNYDCSLANSIPVTAGNFYPDTDFRLELGAIISGTVLDSTGNPITSEIGVSPITGDPCGFHDYLPGTGTNGNGTYILVVPAGSYYLRTNNNNLNYVNEWWNGDSPDPSDFDCNLAHFKTVVAGNTYPVHDFRLETGGTITGTVYNNNGSQTLADMNVCAGSEGCGGQNFGCTWSDGSGNYTISGILLSATAYLNADGHTYLKEYYDGGRGSTNCDDALGVVAGSTWIDFYLGKPVVAPILMMLLLTEAGNP